MTTVTKTKLRITGRVQGVFFRHSACTFARSLKLTGWVRNTADGAVELEAMGESEKIEEFISWCHKGPQRAQITEVKIIWKKQEESSSTDLSFEIVD